MMFLNNLGMEWKSPPVPMEIISSKGFVKRSCLRQIEGRERGRAEVDKCLSCQIDRASKLQVPVLSQRECERRLLLTAWSEGAKEPRRQ